MDKPHQSASAWSTAGALRERAHFSVWQPWPPANWDSEALVHRGDHKPERKQLWMLLKSSPHLHMLKHEPTFKYQTKKKKTSNHLCLGTIEKSFPCPIRNSNRVKQIHEQKKPNHKPEKSTGTASDTVKPSLGEAAMGIFSCWQSKDLGSFPRLWTFFQCVLEEQGCLPLLQ